MGTIDVSRRHFAAGLRNGALRRSRWDRCQFRRQGLPHLFRGSPLQGIDRSNGWRPSRRRSANHAAWRPLSVHIHLHPHQPRPTGAQGRRGQKSDSLAINRIWAESDSALRETTPFSSTLPRSAPQSARQQDFDEISPLPPPAPPPTPPDRRPGTPGSEKRFLSNP